MDTKLVRVDQLQFASFNPRTISVHEFESLQRSIDEFGFLEPVIRNTVTGNIVGGHQRVRAARELGMDEVPVIDVALDLAKEKALNIALNKISGEFDNQMLTELLAGMDEELIALTGFNDEELEKLNADPFDEPIKEDKPRRYSTKELRDLIKSYHPANTEPLELFIDWLERV